MALYKIQSTLYMTSGIPEDSVVNTLWVESTDSAEVTGEFVPLVATALDNFRAHYPSTVRQLNHSIKTYAMVDPEPRAPIDDFVWSFTNAPTGNPAPPELALCLSFQGARISGEPQARRRGRIFVGPLDVGDIHTDGRPTSGLIDDVVLLGQSFLAASLSMTGGRWVVWSPTDASSAEVTDGWVDNAFDIQRRRGVSPTVRTSWDDS